MRQSGSSFQQRTQDFRACRIGVSSFESVHAPIRIKALKDTGVLVSPWHRTGAPENHWYQAVSKSV